VLSVPTPEIPLRYILLSKFVSSLQAEKTNTGLCFHMKMFGLLFLNLEEFIINILASLLNIIEHHSRGDHSWN
jgi:hypothetical protein